MAYKGMRGGGSELRLGESGEQLVQEDLMVCGLVDTHRGDTEQPEGSNANREGGRKPRRRKKQQLNIGFINMQGGKNILKWEEIAKQLNEEDFFSVWIGRDAS